MKTKLLSLAAAATLMAALPANALLIDLEGVETDGAALSSFTVNNADSNAVIDVSFDFTYEAISPSWGSEVILEVFHVDSGEAGQIGTAATSCLEFGVTCEFDLAWDDTSGIFTGSGMFTFAGPIADGSGDWIITVGDSFDDSGIDGQFLAGSSISINQEMPQVPVPATLLLIGIGFTGMGMAARRRRS